MIELDILNVKNITNLKISLPYKKGLYAITGINGIGKSTIFTALAKLVYKSALDKYLKFDGDGTSKIAYTLDGVTNVFEKTDKWKRTDLSPVELKCKGVYEGSIIWGNRFVDAQSDKLPAVFRIVDSDLCDASDFVKSNLGTILKGDHTYYEGLKRVKYKKKALELGFKGIPYLIDREGKRIFQHKMSSGEYMLIGLLDYIDSAQARLARTDEDSANTPPALILLDEIEIALHPAAQCRLATFLDYVADSLNMCVYFSTHSVQVLNVVHADNVYHLARAANGGIEVISPCGPAYATRDMYEPDGFDLIVLVEDILAKNIVEKVIRDGKLNRGKLIRVIPVGGWENTLQLHHELHISKAFGAGTKILSVLDGDVEDKCQAKCRNNPKLGYIKKAFLPIMSLEKYLLNKLVTSPDNMFSREMGDHFFTVRTLADIVSDYRGKTAKDNDGKILLSVLRACIEEQGVDREAFEKGLCSIITGREDHSALLNRLTGAFKSR